MSDSRRIQLKKKVKALVNHTENMLMLLGGMNAIIKDDTHKLSDQVIRISSIVMVLQNMLKDWDKTI